MIIIKNLIIKIFFHCYLRAQRAIQSNNKKDIFFCLQQSILMEQSNSSIQSDNLKALEYLLLTNHKNKFHKVRLKNIILSQYPQYQVIVNIINFQPPIDKDKVEMFIAEVQNLMEINHIQQQLVRVIWRRLYTQIVIGCILENNQVEGQHFLKVLQYFMHCLKDVQEILYTFFGLTSLVALQEYKIEQNKEYKHNETTKSLFFYILSQIRISDGQRLINQSQQIIQKYPNSQNPIVQHLKEQISRNTKNQFLEKVIKLLIQKEKEFLYLKGEVSSLQESKIFYDSISKFIQKKWKIDISSSQNLENIPHQDKHFIKLMKLILQNKQPIILKSLLKTTLIRKIEEQSKAMKLVENNEERIRQYTEFLVRKGQGEIDKYGKCLEGMYLKKCNFNNREITSKFVRLSEEGIAWGKDKKQCHMKFQWSEIRGVLFGNISANFNKNFKPVDSEKCFSLIFKGRSIDFICESRKETMIWLQGITYIINQHRNREGREQDRILMTKGLSLWSELFLRLRKKGQPWQSKAKSMLLSKNRNV